MKVYLLKPLPPSLPPATVFALEWCHRLLAERKAGRLTPEQSAKLDAEILMAAHSVLFDSRKEIRA